MAIHLTPEANPTIQEGTLYVDSATGEFNVAGRTTPHIIPGVLYPAVAGKLLDGNTSHSGNYGTAQSDERSYYYTDIKGSKPIKDPRIGGHFGSQRHKFKSLQLLEQETATHGSNVYSVDGREWIRAVGDIEIQNSGNGHHFNINNTTTFFEITGYFNQFNWLEYLSQSGNARNRWILSVDGTTTTTESSNQVSVDSPLGGRYVDAVSVRNINTGLTTPRIVTIKMTTNSVADNAWASGCELIAQDTSNRNNIQIPSQNVVSYGKKFNVSDTPHYDPFNGFTSGSSVTSYIDTATSLGVENWKESSTYYRPYNGMRVIKWVDSSGTIKTSVTVMPPLAKSLADSNNLNPSALSDNITAASANSEYRPYFGQNDAYDAVGKEPHGGLHEVAKTFHWREFGNGSANGGTNSSSYPDASMLNTSDSFAYVMDDGLTSLSANDFSYNSTYGLLRDNVSDKLYLTFIGTGLTWNTYLGVKNWVQNLPYGTHVLEFAVDASDAYAGTLKIDGVTIKTFADSGDNRINYWSPLDDITIHQPKRPPIPEEAVIVSDYCLMADFVKQTETNSDIRGQISKGSRYVSASRDIFYNASGAFRTDLSGTSNANQIGLRVINSNANPTAKLHFFGTTATFHLEGSDEASVAVTLGGAATSETALDNTSSTHGDALTITDTVDLGLTNTELTWAQDDNLYAIIVDSPIHTSHHYQAFKTPFLHELVGGDRNMEQNNLVCSPDGKTWDEVTRDTSYLGNTVVSTNYGTDVSGSTVLSPDDWRGNQLTGPTEQVFFNKDFAIAYDRMICLVDGQYEISASTISYTSGTGGDHAIIKVNGVIVVVGSATTSGYSSIHNTYKMHLVRGDYVQVFGKWHGGSNGQYNHIQITRL